MLNELHQQALNTGTILQPGFKLKRVKNYVSLSASGAFLGILASGDQEVLAPDMGSLAQGKMSNVLLEKSEIVFSLPETDGTIKPMIREKHDFFLKALKEGSAFEPKFALCATAIENEESRARIVEALFTSKVKPGDIIGFSVDGLRLENSVNYLPWWREFRNAVTSSATSAKKEVCCFITGDPTEPLSTTGKISGLRQVGGHSSGDTLIGFDKDAFCSYGFKQAENAAVSEEAMAAIRGVLEQMLKNAPILAGSKYVHWYKEKVERTADPVSLLLGTDLFEDAPDAESPGQTEDEKSEEINADRRVADHLIKSILSGERPNMPGNRYFILSLTGAGGRVMVRSWMQGCYEDLYENAITWFRDLELNDAFGNWYPKRLTQYYYRLLRQTKSNRSFMDRMSEELSALGQQILYSIVNCIPLPDVMAAKALNYIRSGMLASQTDSDEGTRKTKSPDQAACSLLKAWVNRKNRNKKGVEVQQMNPDLTEDYEGIAYHIGRMMAVYAKVQLEASGNVNAGVVERYYAGACTKPALVMGRLSQLSAHHLSKLEPHKAAYYKSQLAEISTHIHPQLPNQFTLQQQAEFAIGYYQENAFLYKKKDLQ